MVKETNTRELKKEFKEKTNFLLINPPQFGNRVKTYEISSSLFLKKTDTNTIIKLTIGFPSQTADEILMDILYFISLHQNIELHPFTPIPQTKKFQKLKPILNKKRLTLDDLKPGEFKWFSPEKEEYIKEIFSFIYRSLELYKSYEIGWDKQIKSIKEIILIKPKNKIQEQIKKDMIRLIKQNKQVFWDNYIFMNQDNLVWNLYPDDRFIDNIPNKTKTILDIGCSTGLLTNEIGRVYPDKQVVGIDFSETALEIARKDKPNNVTYILDDFDKTQLKGKQFDLIIDRGLLHNIEEIDIYFDNVNKLLKPGGEIRLFHLHKTVQLQEIRDIILNLPYFTRTNKQIISKFKEKGFTLKFEEGRNIEGTYFIFKKHSEFDKPEEVMIETTPDCNFDCVICFNKNNSGKNRREFKEMSTKYTKQIIDSISKSSIPKIRFTGGEPFLREDIIELIKYAYSKRLKVWINTNATLITKKLITEIEDYIDDALVPMNGYDERSDYLWTQTKNSFKKKIKGLGLLGQSKIEYVRCGTIATNENIKNLEKIYNIVKKLNIKNWEVYRPIPTKTEHDIINIKLLYKKLKKLSKDFGKPIFIANSVPFCSYDIEKLDSVCMGGKFDNGHTRIVVDPRGFAKPSYTIQKNLGDPRDIMKCWNHPFMKQIRNLELIPDDCKDCKYLKRCKSGFWLTDKDPMMA